MKLSSEMILTLQLLDGVGNKTIFKIADLINTRVKSLEELYIVLRKLKGKKIESITIEDIFNANNQAKKIIANSLEQNIGLISYFDAIYPNILRKTIDEDGKKNPPLLLWYRGNLSVLEMPGIAVIGTREATPEGIAGGTYISGEFAKRGFNIVSGLAIGCDTCGHIGALKVGGKTTAFLANGLDYESIYPSDNTKLAKDIVNSGGLLLSEYYIGQKVNRYSLVARDRLQAGLSLATIVVQTGVKGGTMHAAKNTLYAGKNLYTMRFKDDSTNNHEKCRGNALLVENGAKYLSGLDNIDEICNQLLKKYKKTLSKI